MRTTICAIIKDEHKYLKEWIDYHLNLGFNKIFLFEDYGSKSHADITKSYPSVILESLDNTQFVDNCHNAGTLWNLYNKMIKKLYKEREYDWVLFSDIDEYLMFEDGYNLDKLLEEYKDKYGIWLCWKMYGANGHIKAPEGSIIENYPNSINVKLDQVLKWNVKSFVNIDKCPPMTTLHTVYKGSTTNGITDANSHKLSYKKAWLNHYFTKSWEDYYERTFSRGNFNNNTRTLDLFFKCNPDLQDKELELINLVRFNHTPDIMYLSKKYKIISGGNVNKLKQINEKYSPNRKQNNE